MSDFNQNIIIDLTYLMSDILITCLILLMMDNFILSDRTGLSIMTDTVYYNMSFVRFDLMIII